MIVSRLQPPGVHGRPNTPVGVIHTFSEAARGASLAWSPSIMGHDQEEALGRPPSSPYLSCFTGPRPQAFGVIQAVHRGAVHGVTATAAVEGHQLVWDSLGRPDHLLKARVVGDDDGGVAGRRRADGETSQPLTPSRLLLGGSEGRRQALASSGGGLPLGCCAWDGVGGQPGGAKWRSSASMRRGMKAAEGDGRW